MNDDVVDAEVVEESNDTNFVVVKRSENIHGQHHGCSSSTSDWS